MKTSRRLRPSRPIIALLALALVAAGCGDDDSTGTSESGTDESTTDAGAIETDGFESLGDVTLNVWADAGEEATLARAEEIFEGQYPNVDVQTTVRGFDDYVTIIVNTMQGGDAPDVAQGNQGYSVDGSLVAGGLILPLDDYAEVYGWTNDFPAGALVEFRFSEDGEAFGQGPLWGLSPVAEFVGVYYNKAKLAELGVEYPATFADFETTLQASLDADERPIQMGNSEAWPGTHVYGVIQAAFTPATDVRDWITGVPGSTFDSASNIASAQKIADWAEAGYFGDDFNGVGNDDAVARFAGGDGVFFIAGNWNTSSLAENMGDDVGFAPMPVGPSGTVGGTGSLGLGWHISTNTDNPDLAAAFLALLHSEEFADELIALGRVPVQPTTALAEGVAGDVVDASGVVQGADGLTFYSDWATDTMFDTLSSKLQELLAGRIDAESFAADIQADWDGFFAG